MKKLFRIAAGVVLTGIVVMTSGCVVVPYREAGLHVTTGGYYGHHHHHRAPACPPHGW